MANTVLNVKSPASQTSNGCPLRDLRARLKSAGLRPTRQRVQLGWLMFGRGDRHLTAEAIYNEADHARFPVSLATVYNTLNQFSAAGLLREIAVDGAKTHFDTRLAAHHHFYFDDTHEMVDIPASAIDFTHLPVTPEGYGVERVDVVVRLKKRG